MIVLTVNGQRHQLDIEPVASVDPLRPIAHVRANAVEVADDVALSNLNAVTAQALITTLLSAEAVGVARWATDTASDQVDAAKNERPHDALAEIGLSDHQRAQSFRRNQQRFNVALGVTIVWKELGRRGLRAYERVE